MALIAVAFACGAIVGIERERQDKPAGLRTIMLICVGSATFTVASVSPALSFNEPARIAAQIVTGVGFLGAGAIMRERHAITGLTTAATIWTTAAIGLVVGAGYAGAGAALSLGVLGTLVLVGRAERIVIGACVMQSVRVVFRDEGGKARFKVQEIVWDAKGPLRASGPHAIGGDRSELVLEHCIVHRDHRAVTARLADLQAVEEIVPVVVEPKV